MQIDLNSDMGESFGAYTIGEDENIINYITSANIACGYHAGDPSVMAKTAALAKQHGVGVGAHPGYPDLAGFGRRNLQTFPGEIRNYILYQIGAMSAFAKAAGTSLQHVKPHGALYNFASENEGAAREIIEAVKSYDPDLILVVLSGSIVAQLAKQAGLKVAQEAFPDRAYLANGQLAPRKLPGSVIHDEAVVRERVVKLITTGKLISIDGKELSLKADTLCIHGDTPGAWKLAKTIRESLEKEGITVAPLSSLTLNT